MKKLLSIALAAMMLASTVAFVPAQAAQFQGGTVITTHDGSAVTVPDSGNELFDGGFEVPAGWNDALNRSSQYWLNAGMTQEETTDAVEGKTVLVIDYPKVTEEKRAEAGFNGVYLAPCNEGEAYCFEFYTKLLTPLDGNVNVLFYYHNPDDSSKKPFVSVNSERFSLNADVMKGSEWENQKWVRVRHYFVTDPSSEEQAFTFQIQNMNMNGPWGTTRLAIDAMTLSKVYIDENEMDPSLFLQSTPAPVKKIKFAKSKITIKKGKKKTLTIKNAKKAKFSVDKKGKKVVKLSKAKAKSVVVTGKKKGKATITAKAGAKKATCKVTVK